RVHEVVCAVDPAALERRVVRGREHDRRRVWPLLLGVVRERQPAEHGEERQAPEQASRNAALVHRRSLARLHARPTALPSAPFDFRRNHDETNMQTQALTAEVRHEGGKGPSRQLRMKGLIPAVFYGPGTEPTRLAVSPKDLRKALSTELGRNQVIELTI